MLRLALRKLMSSPWKTACLFLGCVLALAVASSIPAYTNAILGRTLVKDMESHQRSLQQGSGGFPAYTAIDFDWMRYTKSDRAELFAALRAEAAKIPDYMRTPASLTGEIMTAMYLYHYDSRSELTTYMPVVSMTGFEGHVKVVKGRMFEPNPAGGVTEVVVQDFLIEGTSYSVGDEIILRSGIDPKLRFSVRIVGIVVADEEVADAFWYKDANTYRHARTMFMSDADMERFMFTGDNLKHMSSCIWYAALDYRQIIAEEVPDITEGFRSFQCTVVGLTDRKHSAVFTGTNVLQAYISRYWGLILNVLVLAVPVLILLLYYIFMVARLKVRSEQTEISVMQSRGAAGGQVLGVHLLESALLLIPAAALALPLSSFMCQMIGASNGFLEFVGRRALNVQFTRNTLLAMLLAGALYVLMTLLPVIKQSKINIVQEKAKSARRSKAPVWRKFFLDFILLGVSGYAYYSMSLSRDVLASTGMKPAAGGMDYLLFLASTMFAVGAGLLFLRLYPLVVRLIYRIGRRWWGAVPYASLHQVRYDNNSAGFIMIFLVMTVSVGMFSANAARTINRHVEDNVRYTVGADITIVPDWNKHKGTTLGDDGGPGTDFYINLDIRDYEKIEGAQAVARVFTSTATVEYSEEVRPQAALMAVDPYDFARTVWTRAGLNPHHLNEYMNILTEYPYAVILSRCLADELGLKPNDPVTIQYDGGTAECVVAGFIDYMPGYKPKLMARGWSSATLKMSNGRVVPTRTEIGGLRDRNLVIANLEYLQRRNPTQPYKIWVRKEPGVTDREVYSSIEKLNLSAPDGASLPNEVQASMGYMPPPPVMSSAQEIAKAKNDPVLQGTNGMLSLGFIISMTVCTLGFLIYWILSIKTRALQFGVLRAMGVRRRGVLGMLALEQLMVSGAAIGAGIVIGVLTSRLFVPMYELTYWDPLQPVPFRVIADTGDYEKILIVLGVMLLIGLGVLARIILTSKIDQALKLGED